MTNPINYPTNGVSLGTSPVLGGTPGQALFIDGSGNINGDAGFQWDNTNKRLTIGGTTSANTVTISGSTTGGVVLNFINNNGSGYCGLNMAPASGNAGSLTAGGGAVTLYSQQSGLTMVCDSSGQIFQIRIGGNSNSNIAMQFKVGSMMIGPPVVINAGVGNFNTVPDASAALDVPSTTLGFRPPCMTTTQKNAISSPAEGLIVYDLTAHTIYFWNGSAWTAV